MQTLPSYPNNTSRPNEDRIVRLALGPGCPHFTQQRLSLAILASLQSLSYALTGPAWPAPIPTGSTIDTNLLLTVATESETARVIAKSHHLTITAHQAQGGPPAALPSDFVFKAP